MRFGRRHPHLRAFVLGSLAVHGLLLAVWATSVQFGAEPRAALSVRLDGDTDAAPSAYRERAPRPRAEHTHATALPASIEARAGDEQETGRATPTTAAAKTGNDDEIRAHIESHIRLDLARHFDYPWIAQLRGWEGNVLLGVIVQASGRLDTVRVVRSSGFAVLDRSAVDSLRKVERIPEAVAWLQGRDIEMQLPVLYRLKGER